MTMMTPGKLYRAKIYMHLYKIPTPTVATPSVQIAREDILMFVEEANAPYRLWWRFLVLKSGLICQANFQNRDADEYFEQIS